MPSPSKELELDRISMELGQLTLRRQQLNHRQNLLAMVKEFRNVHSSQSSEDSDDGGELASVKRELQQLSERKGNLIKQQDVILHTNGQISSKKDDACHISHLANVPFQPSSGPSVVFVDAPPSIPAPLVVLDVEKLPPYPCKTQCPSCQQFVTTETVSSVGHVTWLVCLMSVMIGCVAGCCLIPFCVDAFRDVEHKCPRCRSRIHMVKKL